jgi:hypothetical protein
LTLPQKNAVLLRVTEGGTAKDWDSDTDGSVKFQGKAAAYYTERKERLQGIDSTATAQSADLVKRRTVIVEPGFPDITFEDDDVVLFTYKDREISAVVDIVEEMDLPGQPVYGTVRLHLKVE